MHVKIGILPPCQEPTDPIRLRRLLHKRLDAEAEAQLREHLAECVFCAQRFEDMRAAEVERNVPKRP